MSAIILGAAALLITWIGGIFFTSLVIIVGVLLYYEWSTIIQSEHKQPLAHFVGWSSLLMSFILIISDLSEFAFIALFSGAAMAAIIGFKKDLNLWMAVGIIYSGFPVIALYELRGEDRVGFFAIIFIFAIVWATDIFAYFCGRALGGAKLAPSISPNKTWSGAVSGLVAGAGIGLSVVLMVRDGGGIFVPMIAIVLSLSSQIGDLFESGIKRRYGVKDSSHLIPGHGGFMDRLDGLIFAAITAFIIALFEQYYAGSNADPMLAVHLLGL